MHLSELLEGAVRLDDYHFLNFPGGFLDGDDLGSAKAGVNRLRHAPVQGSGEKVSEHLRIFNTAARDATRVSACAKAGPMMRVVHDGK